MRLACVQCNVTFADPTENAKHAIERLGQLKAEGVDLVVFPEAYLTGYCVADAAGAASISIAADSDPIRLVEQACNDLDILAVMGFAELRADHLFNSAVIFEPGQTPRIYRKTHLPELGLDKFVEAGTELPVFETRLGKIGILICFDLRPPEATRVLALAGAEILVLPTNWPVGAETSAAHICIARAAENRIFVATCNRVGTENGFTFIGQSKIIDVTGKVLAAADADEEVIVSEIDLSSARLKRTISIPGKYETEVFTSRNPKLYGPIVKG